MGQELCSRLNQERVRIITFTKSYILKRRQNNFKNKSAFYECGDFLENNRKTYD
jgi:hypothetical protein